MKGKPVFVLQIQMWLFMMARNSLCYDILLGKMTHGGHVQTNAS